MKKKQLKKNKRMESQQTYIRKVITTEIIIVIESKDPKLKIRKYQRVG